MRGRATRSGGCWLITLFLVNEQPTPRDNKDEAWLFQPKLTVTAPGDSTEVAVTCRTRP